ncbi:MAG: 2-amino-4-hydroxy-6-hydroxymethyldihydropteridine diphosphokinase [Smithellaceae bacterium]
MICYIGLGSNMGDPARNCRHALTCLSRVKGVKILRVSSLYRTQPVLPPSQGGWSSDEARLLENQDWFINAVAEIRTTLSARGVLQNLQHIEESMGRRRIITGGPRIIDLDLLFYGQDVMKEADLIVPHPEAHKRRFVLEPMCEIASYYIHPLFGVSMRGLKERLEDRNQVLRYRDENEEGPL